MDPKELIEMAFKTLIELPDATGLLRCVYFADLFRELKTLKDAIAEQEQTYKEEKLKLEAEILDLKEKLDSYRKE